jgi:hypothetical protein
MTHSSQDLQQLQALNKKFIHNFVTNDVPSHDKIIHPLFRTVTSTGAHMARESYLHEWATGFDPDAIPYWDMRNERITLHENVALVTATTKYIRVRDGQETPGMTCYTDTYVRTPEGWRCVLAQLTPVAPANFPGDETIVVKYIRGVLQ